MVSSRIETLLRSVPKKSRRGLNPAARGKRSSVGSAFDGVGPLVANLLAGYDQPVLLRQRAARAQHGPPGVPLPAHRRHNFLQRRAAFALEHRDDLARLAALARRARRGCFLCGGGVALRDKKVDVFGGLGLRESLLRRDVGRVWRNGRSRGGLRGRGKGCFGLSRFRFISGSGGRSVWPRL